MSLIERWWRVVPQPNLSTQVTWCSEDPSGRLEAAWEGAMVTEYVRADLHQGAVEALKSIAFTDHEHPQPSASALRTRAFVAWKAATHQGGQYAAPASPSSLASDSTEPNRAPEEDTDA